MEEVWLYIAGFENKYQISNKANVRSLNYNNTGKPKVLIPKINRQGCREVTLSLHDKKHYRTVARLVAEAFIPNPQNKPKVARINNDKLDDRPENLKWVYDSELRFMMYEKGNRGDARPSGNKIGYNGEQYKNFSDLARANGLTPRQLFKRLSRGWSLKEALETPIERENFIVHAPKHEYYDEELTIKEISNRTGIGVKQIHKRLSRGWSIYECEIPISIYKRTKG